MRKLVQQVVVSGPAYEDKVARRAIRVADLVRGGDHLKAQLEEAS